ncbi:MAG: MarR family winged helix-turn-helix transcriptional regulator [Rhodospirillales bacterium]
MTPPRKFDLDRYLPYLINRAAVRFVGSIAPTLADCGVSLQEWRVLAALRRVQRQRVSDLAEMTSIDISTLSRTLSAMQRRGLVERQRPADGDARVVHVRATEHGRTVTDRIAPAAQALETTALAGFTAAEAEALKDMLERIFGNIGSGLAPSAAGPERRDPAGLTGAEAAD